MVLHRFYWFYKFLAHEQHILHIGGNENPHWGSQGYVHWIVEVKSSIMKWIVKLHIFSNACLGVFNLYSTIASALISIALQTAVDTCLGTWKCSWIPCDAKLVTYSKFFSQYVTFTSLQYIVFVYVFTLLCFCNITCVLIYLVLLLVVISNCLHAGLLL